MAEERQDSAEGVRPAEEAEPDGRLFASLYGELRRLADASCASTPE